MLDSHESVEEGNKKKAEGEEKNKRETQLYRCGRRKKA